MFRHIKIRKENQVDLIFKFAREVQFCVPQVFVESDTQLDTFWFLISFLHTDKGVKKFLLLLNHFEFRLETYLLSLWRAQNRHLGILELFAKQLLN